MTADPFIIAALNEPTIIFHSDTAEICCKWQHQMNIP